MSVLRPWCAAEFSAFSNALSAHPVQPVTRYGRMGTELLLPSRRQLHILPDCRFYSRVSGLLVHPCGYLDDAFRAIQAGSKDFQSPGHTSVRSGMLSGLKLDFLRVEDCSISHGGGAFPGVLWIRYPAGMNGDDIR